MIIKMKGIPIRGNSRDSTGHDPETWSNSHQHLQFRQLGGVMGENNYSLGYQGTIQKKLLLDDKSVLYIL